MDTRNIQPGRIDFSQQPTCAPVTFQCQHIRPQPARQISRYSRATAIVRSSSLRGETSRRLTKSSKSLPVQQRLIRHQHKYTFHARPQAANTRRQRGRYPLVPVCYVHPARRLCAAAKANQRVPGATHNTHVPAEQPALTNGTIQQRATLPVLLTQS